MPISADEFCRQPHLRAQTCCIIVRENLTPALQTHANAVNVYDSAYAAQQAILQDAWLKTRQGKHDSCERHATTVAQGAINAMLPAGSNPRTCRKSDYAGKLNGQNLKEAVREHKDEWEALKPGYAVTKVKKQKLGGVKPETGAFVCGVQQGGQWVFYYQAIVNVTVEFAQSPLWQKREDRIASEGLVLGRVEQSYP